MQQLIHQLTNSSVHSAGRSNQGLNGRRRLALSHTVYSAPIFDHAEESPSGRGLSNQAIVLTTILTFFGLVLMAVAFYQWSLIQRQQVDIQRVRSESADRMSAINAKVLGTPIASDSRSSAEVLQRREISAYVSDIKPLVLMWRDAQTRAELAEGPSVRGALNTLREVESRAAAVVPPAEAQEMHERLLACMHHVVEEFEAASQTGVDGAVAIRANDAREAFDSVAVEFAALQTTSGD